MPLLDITVSKRNDYLCSLEESTAKQADRYAHFLKVPADEVVNSALEYVFTKDKDFTQFLEETKNAEAPLSLRKANDASEDGGDGRSRRKNGGLFGEVVPNRPFLFPCLCCRSKRCAAHMEKC